MDKDIKEEGNDISTKDQFEKVKPFQELSDEISTNPKLEKNQPTLHPKDFDQIEY